MKQRTWFVISMIFLGIFAMACDKVLDEEEEKPREFIEDISYNIDDMDYLNYTVYIKESEFYAPYIVVTDDYNGHVLLVRKHVLEEKIAWNSSGRMTGYYEDSIIDNYLNEEFIKQLDSNVVGAMVESEIPIITKESMGSTGNDTIKINRNIFLLGYSEVTQSNQTIAADEGETLAYFANADSLSAYNESGEKYSWWLRTTYTWYDTTAWVVGYDGSYGAAEVDIINGVRPAFCIEKGIEIETIEGIIVNQSVYVLKQNK